MMEILFASLFVCLQCIGIRTISAVPSDRFIVSLFICYANSEPLPSSGGRVVSCEKMESRMRICIRRDELLPIASLYAVYGNGGKSM